MARQKQKNIRLPQKNDLWYYILLIMAVLVAFGGALGCKFTNWDDNAYVTANDTIMSWSGPHLKTILFGFTAGNYHPLTMLSFSLDYFLFRANPAGYHFTNLVLHGINTCLVFRFVQKLTPQKEIAFLTALFFGIQPMHAESVVWISERKDLLYTFFLLLSMIAYLDLPADSNRYSFKKYGRVFLFFFLALLSKGQAVILPVLLLLLDHYRNEWKRTRWLEKIPFFLIAFCFGIIAIHAQQSTEAMLSGKHLDVLQRVLAAGYGIFTYTWKAVLPVQLSCLHPYPPSLSSNWYFYLCSVVVLTGILFVFIQRKKNQAVFFGITFFLVALLPVLQLLPVGIAITAERYTYVAYIGLFFALFSLLAEKSLKKTQLIIPITIAAIGFAILSWNRCHIWNDNFSLWSDVIEQYPECAIPYCNRGVAYSDNKQTDLAEKDFLKAVEYDSLYSTTLNNLGLINYNKNNFDSALDYYNKAIHANAQYGEAYNNRGVALMRKGFMNEGFADFNRSISFAPLFANGWRNRGNFFIQKGDTIRGLDDMKRAAMLYKSQGEKEAYNETEDRIRAVSIRNF